MAKFAIDTEHGLIFVSEKEFNDVKSRYECQTLTTDDACYSLRFDVVENYIPGVTLGRSLLDRKLKERVQDVPLEQCLIVLKNYYKNSNKQQKIELLSLIQKEIIDAKNV
jgi:hypothetical protein